LLIDSYSFNKKWGLFCSELKQTIRLSYIQYYFQSVHIDLTTSNNYTHMDKGEKKPSQNTQTNPN